MKLWYHPESECYFYDTDPGEGLDGALCVDVTGDKNHERAAWAAGLRRVVCPYCGKEARLADSVEVYSRSYGMIWLCVPCRAWVGVHKGDGQNRPLGRLANAELREWKKRAHAAFDPMWTAKMRRDQCSKKHARGAGYKWLAEQLGIPIEECHIGMMDVDRCKRVVEACRRGGRDGRGQAAEDVDGQGGRRPHPRGAWAGPQLSPGDARGGGNR